MRTIQVIKKPKENDWSYVELNQSHYDELLNDSATIVDQNGEIIFVFLKKALSKQSAGLAWNAIKDWNPQSPLRSMAKGIKQEYKYKDGVKTNYLKNRTYCCSGVMGYFDRFPTVPCCRPCSFNSLNPEKFEMMLPITKEVAKLHAEFDPKSWVVYDDFSKRVHDDWKIAGTPYNTITMNKNFQTFPHKDGKNMPASCPMTIIRKGSYRGGYLVFPEYRIAINIDTTDLILFMNSTEWHGNTRITGTSPDYVRSSFIWYCRKNMDVCLSEKEELERVKNLNFGPTKD